MALLCLSILFLNSTSAFAEGDSFLEQAQASETVSADEQETNKGVTDAAIQHYRGMKAGSECIKNSDGSKGVIIIRRGMRGLKIYCCE